MRRRDTPWDIILASIPRRHAGEGISSGREEEMQRPSIPLTKAVFSWLINVNSGKGAKVLLVLLVNLVDL